MGYKRGVGSYGNHNGRREVSLLCLGEKDFLEGIISNFLFFLYVRSSESNLGHLQEQR